MSTLETCAPMDEALPFTIHDEHGNEAEAADEASAMLAARTLRRDWTEAGNATYYTAIPSVAIFYRGRLALTIPRGPNADLDTYRSPDSRR